MWRCVDADVEMWRRVDVRFVDVVLWRCGDVGVEMCRCEVVEMCRCGDV